MLITDRPSADVDALRSRLYGDVVRARRRRLGRGAARVEPRRRSAARRRRLPADRRRRRRGRRLRPRGGSARRSAGDRPRRRRDRLARGHDPDQHEAHARRADRSRHAPRARACRCRLGRRDRPAAAYGLAPLAGSARDVGVVGYTLGGGLSWLGRKHGLACNSVIAIELVTADGRHVRTDAANDPELFWALRGGGGAVRRRDRDRVRALPGRGAAWRRADVRRSSAPRRSSPRGATGRRPCRTRSPRCAGSSTRRAASVRRRRGRDPRRRRGPRAAARARPQLDLVGPMSPAALIEIHNDPKQPVPGMTGHRLLAGAPDVAIAELVAHASDALVAVELRHLGGALGRTSVCHGALAGLQGEFSLFAVGVVPDAEAAMTVDVALARLTAGARAVGRRPRVPELQRRAPRASSTATPHRLRALKAQMDGDGLFRRSAGPARRATAGLRRTPPTASAMSWGLERPRRSRLRPPRRHRGGQHLVGARVDRRHHRHHRSSRRRHRKVAEPEVRALVRRDRRQVLRRAHQPAVDERGPYGVAAAPSMIPRPVLMQGLDDATAGDDRVGEELSGRAGSRAAVLLERWPSRARSSPCCPRSRAGRPTRRSRAGPTRARPSGASRPRSDQFLTAVSRFERPIHSATRSSRCGPRRRARRRPCWWPRRPSGCGPCATGAGSDRARPRRSGGRGRRDRRRRGRTC